MVSLSSSHCPPDQPHRRCIPSHCNLHTFLLDKACSPSMGHCPRQQCLPGKTSMMLTLHPRVCLARNNRTRRRFDHRTTDRIDPQDRHYTAQRVQTPRRSLRGTLCKVSVSHDHDHSCPPCSWCTQLQTRLRTGRDCTRCNHQRAPRLLRNLPSSSHMVWKPVSRRRRSRPSSLRIRLPRHLRTCLQST